jgi:CBS domain-containing protein
MFQSAASLTPAPQRQGGQHDYSPRHHARREHETLAAAAQQMRDLGVGALPICGDDDRLHGMITDRDIVIKGLAAGSDPAHWRSWYQVRRLPVIENHRLVGIVSEADVARHLPEHAIVQFVKAIYSPKALTGH